MNLLTKSAPRISRPLVALAAGMALAGSAACGKSDTLGSTSPVVPAYEVAGGAGGVDILFMIDNSSSMTSMQQKLVAQIPMFLDSLQSATRPLSDFHIAVVSSDLGAPSDSDIGCTTTGDQGLFQSQPLGTCQSSTLAPGATYISNVGGVANYTGQLNDVLSCITPLGSNGCGFEHQLASVVRALGADGQPAPAANTGFLRQDAELAIFLLTNEDDCSAPDDTKLYSLNGYGQNLADPLGPIGNYRCNQFGHLCRDPNGTNPSALIAPPLNPPSDAAGSGSDMPTLNLVDCESNDTSTGSLTPVSKFIAEIKALKADPSRITVGALVAPSTPYTVEWLPGAGISSNELWPNVEHSCGPQGGANPLATDVTTDGSFGDPGVRITEWVHAFGDNGVIGSICDDYGLTMGNMAGKVLTNRGPAPDAGTAPAADAGTGTN
jgi:hypothetical protein